MADDATLTIAVKVRDEATRQLGALSGRVRSVLLTPFNAVGKSVAGIVKNLFGLKSLLVGGGAIGLMTAQINALAKNAREFVATFSAEEQTRIDQTAESIRRLGAQLQRTFGVVVSDQADGIAGFFDSITVSLRDNAPAIRGFFSDAAKFFKDAAAFVRVMQSGDVTLGTLFRATGEGKAATEARMQLSNAMAMQRELAALKSAADQLALSGVFRPGGFNIGDDSVFAQLMSADMASNTAALEVALKSLDGAGEDMAAQWDAVANALSKYRTEATDAGNVTAKLTTETKAVTEAVKQFIVTTEEIAGTVADGITDSFFDIIKGTKSVGRAFADMAASIAESLSRLFITRALFQVINTALGGSPVDFAGVIGPGKAMGTASASAGAFTVGERGPERVILPRGARVEPSHRSSGNGGGVTINVIGARDPQATAAEVLSQLRTNPAFKRAFA